MSVDGVGAVVLTHGTGGDYEPLLDSLLAEGMAPERIVLIHNPSAPGEPAPSAPAGCEVLSGTRNLGYAIGMNRGIARQLERGCEFVFVLTHDARLRSGSLQALVDAARQNPEYGVLGPALVLAGTEIPFSHGGITLPNGSVEHIHERPSTDAAIVPCDWIDGGTMLFRAELLRRIGGFNEQFWLYAEDAEICLRATQSGAGVGVLLAAEADQAPGGAKRPAAWSYLMARNGATYAYRAKGLRGLLSKVGSTLRETALNLARALARRLGLRDGPAIEPWSLAVGSGRGLLDLLRRRWGPPPPMPGGGDIKNTGE
jgi:GT2 family glycosyltransferase